MTQVRRNVTEASETYLMPENMLLELIFLLHIKIVLCVCCVVVNIVLH